MKIVKHTRSDGVSAHHSAQMLARFNDVQEAIADSDLRLLYKLSATVNVNHDQVTYYVGASDELFVVTATDLEDDNYIVSCDRARRYPQDGICYIEKETDTENFRLATHQVIEQCLEFMKEVRAS